MADGQQGARAVGRAQLVVKTPYDTQIKAYAEDQNVVHATIKAFVAAINTAERARARAEA